MIKLIYSLLLACLLFLSGCRSIGELSIDYMVPAEISFPPELKRVGVVNNMPAVPDNKLIVSKDNKSNNKSVIAHLTNYYNGDAKITTESLAKALVGGNYFDEVVICDSALRLKDITPREATLSREEVKELTDMLGVDCLVSLENIQIRSLKKLNYWPGWNMYEGTTDVSVYPVVKIYLPNRKGAMVTINAKDSIFWEESGHTEASVLSRMITEEEIIKQASDFAGSVPIKKMLPYWESGNRFLFTGGNVNMRDAAIYVKKENWDKAIELWKQTYNGKKKKRKMQAAHNLAVAYEMKDSIETAVNWETKAQELALAIDKVEEKREDMLVPEMIPNYVETTRYLFALQKRSEGLTRLRVQMQRFNDDF